ncbi:hypothetical protein V1514DRAFT_94186 [Lipomyces japonicus]|uniref:uncharacterized protein n=1 Tax=Lipomyces japonicus TaxID=56871 RepID=UPI0034CD955D
MSAKSFPPGPIPAAPPSFIRRDEHGVDWIAFQYSKNRVRTEYCIRCDISSVNVQSLSVHYRNHNCIYPGANMPRHQYTGNRYEYENECNKIGWALAHLNPSLRGRKGLLQRAVDSWRNSSENPKLRSRQTRRNLKQNFVRDKIIGGITSAVNQNYLAAPSHQQYDDTIYLGMSASLSPCSSSPGSLTSLSEAQVDNTVAMSSLDQFELVDPLMFPSSAMPVNAKPRSLNAHEASDNSVPLVKCKSLPKYIMISNASSTQAKAKIRVRVMIEKVDLQEVPDKYRVDHAVFPTSIMPLLSPHFQQQVHDGHDNEDDYYHHHHEHRVLGTNLNEQINEMGIKITWLQPRLFEGKFMLLQRVLDCYRAKLVKERTGPASMSVRKGKALWLQARSGFLVDKK